MKFDGRYHQQGPHTIEICIEDVVHLWIDPKTSRIANIAMCGCGILGYKHTDLDIVLSDEDQTRLREYLDEHLFHFGVDDKGMEGRRRQRQVIESLSK